MKKLVTVLVSVIITLPNIVNAECLADGFTVVFVNGILKTETEANVSTLELQRQFAKRSNFKNVKFKTGYNPTHLAGAGDLAQAAAQIFGSSITDFDLQTILTQIHPEVTTRKVFLVGHSQGAFYTNAMYDYFLTHGVPKESVGVYNVGTPAASTAGGGKYITAKQDLMIKLLTDAARKAKGQLPLPPNADIPLLVEDFKSAFPGHSFAGAYLKGAPERVISEISDGLGKLQANDAHSGDCFTAPDATFTYRTQQVMFGVADPTAYVVREGVFLTYQGGVVVFTIAANAVQKGYALVQSAFGVASAPEPRSPEDSVKDFEVVKSLYGSSLKGSDVKDLHMGGQGAAVAAALGGRVAGVQTKSSDVESVFPIRYVSRHSKTQEQMGDIGVGQNEESTSLPVATPRGFFTASTTPPVVQINECAYSLKKEFCLIPTRSVRVVWDALPEAAYYRVQVGDVQTEATVHTLTVLLPDNASSSIRVTAYDSAGAAATSSTESLYVATRPLVISEIGWMGTNAAAEDQWMELENLTPYWLDFAHLSVETVSQTIPLDPMSNFYTTFASTSGYSIGQAPLYTFVRSDGVFRNSKIYTSPSYTPVVPFVPLSASGEQVSLVWNMGSTTQVLDQTPPVAACGGWCGGDAASTTRHTRFGTMETDTLSMERKSSSRSGTEADNWVSNDGYYVNASPTKDRAGTIVLATPFEKNSRQAPEVGFSCNDHPDIVRPGDHVVSAFGDCLFYTGFLSTDMVRQVKFYVGVEGSSTPLYAAQQSRNEVLFMRSRFGDEIPVPVGTPLFLAVVPGTLSLEFSRYIEHGTREGLLPPSNLYRVVPFVYGP